jgi:hypothetical protein
MSSQNQTTKGIKDFLWNYSIITFVLAGLAFMGGVTSLFQSLQEQHNPHEDWKTILGGLVFSMLIFVGNGYLPYKASNFLQKTTNQTLSAIGFPFIEKILNSYFKIFAICFVILLINLFVLFILLICLTIGSIYSIIIVVLAIIIIFATIGIVLLSDSFKPFDHLKETWEILLFPAKFFELERDFLKTLYINPSIIIPFSLILFIIIPNVLAGFVLINKEKFQQK